MLYIVQENNTQLYKIGYTKNLKRVMNNFKFFNPNTTLIGFYYLGDRQDLKDIKKFFKKDYMAYGWYYLTEQQVSLLVQFNIKEIKLILDRYTVDEMLNKLL